MANRQSRETKLDILSPNLVCFPSKARLKLNCHRDDMRGRTWFGGETGAVKKVQSSSCFLLPLRLFTTARSTQKALLDATLLLLDFPLFKDSVLVTFCS